jgi:hypothetical protein
MCASHHTIFSRSAFSKALCCDTLNASAHMSGNLDKLRSLARSLALFISLSLSLHLGKSSSARSLAASYTRKRVWRVLPLLLAEATELR